MKSYRKELWFETKNRMEFINISSQVEKCLEESEISEGFALVNAMHITASVFIMMMKEVCITIMPNSWSGWRRTSRSRITGTTIQAKTMVMLISSARSWDAKLL